MEMTYQSLTGTKGATGSIKTWVNSDSIEPDVLVGEAEDMIFQALRHWNMISTALGTVTQGATAIDVPERFRQSVSLEMMAPTQVKMVPKAPYEIEALRFYFGTTAAIGTSVPSFYGVKGTKAEFPAASDQVYLYRWVYFADPIPLGTTSAGTSSTNFVTSTYPRMMRAACMAQAFEFLRKQDEKIYWLKILEQRIDEANAEAAQSVPAADLGWPSNFI